MNHNRILPDPPPRVIEIEAKINKWDLIKLKNLNFVEQKHNKGNCRQGEKTVFRMGENNSK